MFILQHSYEWEHQGETIEETKLIGIYSTREKAEQIIEKYKILPGFKKHPLNCFYIDELKLDEDHWKEGFGFDD
jgi:hypothetical protein